MYTTFLDKEVNTMVSKDIEIMNTVDSSTHREKPTLTSPGILSGYLWMLNILTHHSFLLSYQVIVYFVIVVLGS